MSRHNALDNLSLNDDRAAMEGFCSTRVSERTVCEMPGAYKPIDDIIGPIAESVDNMRPIYIFKASQGKLPSMQI